MYLKDLDIELRYCQEKRELDEHNIRNIKHYLLISQKNSVLSKLQA